MRWGGGDVRGRSNELLIRSTGRRRQVRSGYMGGEEQLEARKCLTEKGTSMGNIKSARFSAFSHQQRKKEICGGCTKFAAHFFCVGGKHVLCKIQNTRPSFDDIESIK